jgi:hypothetical protein
MHPPEPNSTTLKMDAERPSKTETFNNYSVQKCTIMGATDFTTLRKPEDILVMVQMRYPHH